MKYITFILLSILLIICSCNEKKITKKKDLNNKIIYIEKNVLDPIPKELLPLGLKKIIDSSFNPITKSKKDVAHRQELFSFYNSYEKQLKNINPTLYKITKDIYTPKIDMISQMDKEPLLDFENPSINIFDLPFTAIYILPKIKNTYPVIFRGKTNSNNYEYYPIDRTDLVFLDESLEVINSINISYFYSNESSVKYKYYYIDSEYNLYIRYYIGNENDGDFSIMEKIKLKELTEKSINTRVVKSNRFAVGSTVHAQVETYLNMRSEPNSSGAIIAKIYPTNTLKIVEVLDNWLKVSLNGKEGYVNSDFVKEAP